MMHWTFATFHPELYEAYFSYGLMASAQSKGLCSFETLQFKDFTHSQNRSRVDDTPYGGGEGMVLKVDVLTRTFESLSLSPDLWICLTPAAPVFQAEKAKRWAKASSVVMLSGRFSGFDERIFDLFPFERCSVGDFVLTSGDLPALMVTDAVLRHVPGVLGDEKSAQKDSFEDGFLEAPLYTRPAEFRDLRVPEVLVSGHHHRIQAYQRREQLRLTARYRPDLLQEHWETLTSSEKKWVKRFWREGI